VNVYIQNAASLWKTLKTVKKASEPFSLASDSLELANRAAAGDLGAYNPAVEKLRAYVATQKATLTELARNDENYWMDRSGANAFDRAAMIQARARVDKWIQDLTALNSLIRAFIPAVRAARLTLNNPAIMGARTAMEETSLVGLDAIALDQVVADLNYSSTRLDLICQRLRTCRSAMK
jgi:hypothetical protein